MSIISFKGSMPRPLYEHGPIQYNGKPFFVSRREWLYDSWQYTLTAAENLITLHLTEQQITTKAML